MNARDKNQFDRTLLIYILFLILYAGAAKATDNSWDLSDRGPLGGNIQAVAIDPQNQNKVYIGTLGGGFYWTENFQSNQPSWHQKNDNLPCWNILSLMIKGNKIYAGTTSGLFYLDLVNIRSAVWLSYWEDQLGSYSIFRLRNCEDIQHPEAFYAIGYHTNNDYKNQLIILEGNKQPNFAGSILRNTDVFDVAPYRQKDHKKRDILGRIFVATEDGLYRFNNFFDPSAQYIHILSHTKINCLAERLFLRSPADTAFIVYAGTPQGGKFSVLENQEEPWKDFLKDSAITHLEPCFSNTVSPVQEDIVRIYAITQGAHIFCKDEITYEDVQIWPEYSRTGLSSPSINSFAVPENNIEFLLAGSNDGIYSNINNAGWKSKNFESLFAHRIHAIIENDNRLWCGSDGMLFDRQIGIDPNWIEKKIFKFITTIASHPGANKIYFGTKGEGIFWTYKQSASAISFNRGQLPDNSSISALEIEQKTSPNIYAGTEDGKIYRYKSSEWKEVVVLDSEPVTSIAIDSAKILDGNKLYISQDKKVYQINSNDKYSTLPFFWNANSYVNSIVFNKTTNELFAGTSRGIKFHAVNEEISKNWLNYPYLALSDSNIQELHIIPTDPAFKGVLYAMTSDSVNRFSRIWRNIIGTDIKDVTIGYPNGQYGESFCVNSNNPNIVYMGTAGTGVFKYEFDQGRTPYIRPGPIDFGNIPQNTTKSDTITIKNYNSFSPLIFLVELGDTANFRLNIPDSLVLYPGETKICSLTFRPQKYEDIKSSLKIGWRDIFIPPVLKGSHVIALSGTGKGGDFVIDNSCYLKVHILDTDTISLNWKKEGNVSFRNFRVIPPPLNVRRTIKLLGDKEGWQNEFNNPNKSSGIVRFSFHPIIMSENIGLDSILIEYDIPEKGPPKQKIKINIAWKGLDAKLSTENDTIHFDDIPVDDRSYQKKLVLKNEGNIPLIVDSVFVQPETSPFIIEKGFLIPDTIRNDLLGKNINLFFVPKEEGEFQNHLIIAYHDSSLVDCDETVTVKLFGKGVEHKIEPFPLSALNFDSIHVKKLPQDRILYIKNISPQHKVWVDNLKLKINDVFKIIDPDSFELDPYDGIHYKQDSIHIRFNKCDLFKYHEDTLEIFYRYGKPGSKIDGAIRTAPITGTIISSWLSGTDKDTNWNVSNYIDEQKDTTFEFQNIGNIPLYFETVHTPSKPPWEFSFESKGKLLPNAPAKTIKITFTPVNTSRNIDSIRIHFWDLDNQGEVCSDKTLTISLKGEGIDNKPPSIDSPEYTSPIWKKKVSISAKIYDRHSGLKADSILLFIRKGGDYEFEPITMKASGILDSIFTYDIPGNKITSKGIEFFIEAVDKSGNKTRYPALTKEFRYISPPIQITEPGLTKTKNFDDSGEKEFLQGGNAQQYYQFISIPLDGLTHSAKDILKESFSLEDFHGHRWRCIDYQFEALSGRTKPIVIDTYSFDKPFSNFAPGKSFLLLIDYRYPKRFIQPQTGWTVPTDRKFKYPVHPGWNFIANPFNFPIPIDHICLSKFKTVNLIAHEGKWIDYSKLDESKQILFPWEGAAVFSNLEDTLFICPNFNEKYGPTTLSSPIEKPEYAWFISINASCEQAQDIDNIAAVLKEASESLDHFDRPEPPAIGEYVKVCFLHPEWQQACDEYAIDARPLSSDGYVWDFEVNTNISTTQLSLDFNDIATVPSDYRILVICEELNLEQNLREKNSIFINCSSQYLQHHFKLLVGKEQFINHFLKENLVPKDYKLYASYPNPFWMNAEIRYEIPRDENVTILIYNLLGELIKTIELDIQPAGKHSAFWDGTDEKNIPVANGIYFCKFLTPSFSQTIKMTLLR
ncbi:MAG: FlgD immunoglobulin-like domain containing protein [Candidatus Aenigmatarchaeota archaeon]